ncbi:hypothetical protein [Shewanella sp. MM_2022_3]|uniref:hypothetical protein n=1 Tax=Shewanella sp. MM_2022_3 TaxID=2923280 RepID=UPI001F4C2A5C|nr:hypothetical protein [Shewanella sp. MM_2022_3]MCH7421475.1 hypothetical protein [Shewanella sp. MM_2022_3]
MGTFIVKGLLAVLKQILTAIASEALMQWVILSLAEMAAKHTATTWDDELVARIKAAMESEKK